MKKAMKKAKQVLLLLLIITMLADMLPISATAEEIGSSTPENIQTAIDNGSFDLSKWLSYMPDDTPISRLNLQGSHDTGCYAPMPVSNIALLFPFIYPFVKNLTVNFAQTQTLNIPAQLDKGVRVLDLRGGCYLPGDDPRDMWVNHKLPMYVSGSAIHDKILTMEIALLQVEEWLKKHPTETVVVMLNDEGTPLYPDKRVKLIKQLARRISFYFDDNFVYYSTGATVPKLKEVRGKCVVLCLQDDPKPVTKYEDHYNAEYDKKKEYLENFFFAHNADYGSSIFTNKTAAYYKDIFTKENYENEGGKMGNPQVKLVYYSANNGPIKELPKDYKGLKKFFGNSMYLSEVRYGWIFQDWIGEDDPIGGIIYSNTGCTNYYASLDISSCLDSPYFIYLTKDRIRVFQKLGDEKIEISLSDDKLQMEKDGNYLEIKIIGLPLYSANGTRYEYTVEFENELFQLTQCDTEVTDEYRILDGKWCGRKITEVAKIEKTTKELPLEIQYVIDEDVAEYFKEPTNNNDFFDICQGIEFIRNPGNTKYTVFSIATDFTAHLDEFEKKDDGEGKYYYETKVVNLPSGDGKGSEYSYTLNRAILTNSERANYRLRAEITEGKTGPRIVVEVHGLESKKLVSGTIHWWDGDDCFEKRYPLLTDGEGQTVFPLTMNKYTVKHPYMKDFVTTISESLNLLTTVGNTTFIEYYTNAYDSYGLEFECTYAYSDSLLNGHYIKSNQKDNEVTYVLNGKADFSVIWKKEPPDGITSRTAAVTSSDGKSIKFTAKKSSETTSESEKIWSSETCMLPMFADEETTIEYVFTKSEDMKLDGYAHEVLITTDIDEDGITCWHFYLIYDKAADDYGITVISGSANKERAEAEELVTITAAEGPYGVQFNKWLVLSGGAELDDETEFSTYFIMPAADVTLQATYTSLIPDQYGITVINGSSEWETAVTGANVSIIANQPPAGMEFDKWVADSGSVSFADAASSSTSFVMPAEDVTVRATYKEIVVPVTEYSITVINGVTEWGTAVAGSTISIIANQPAAGMVFDKWEVVSGSVSFADTSSSTTSFIMPMEDVVVSATYKNAVTPDLEYNIWVIGGRAGSTIAKPGEIIPISADSAATGTCFSGWTSIPEGVMFQNSSSSATLFVMPACDVYIKANFAQYTPVVMTYAITVINGYADKTVAQNGEAVFIVSNTADTGKEFAGWEVTTGNTVLENALSTQTSFVMPPSNVTITALFKEKEIIKEDEPEPVQPTPESEIKSGYLFIGGDSRSYVLNSGEKISYTCDGPMYELKTVQVDNTEVGKDCYFAEPGTTVTFKNSYLDTLAVGSHAVKFIYKDAESPEGRLIVSSAEDTGKEIKKAAFTCLLALLILILIAVTAYCLNKNQKAKRAKNSGR